MSGINDYHLLALLTRRRNGIRVETAVQTEAQEEESGSNHSYRQNTEEQSVLSEIQYINTHRKKPPYL